jgi:hypothetical protein
MRGYQNWDQASAGLKVPERFAQDSAGGLGVIEYFHRVAGRR